jgi:L-alanine-DL-glutamate epimerase-like enolase superfamily enzyme
MKITGIDTGRIAIPMKKAFKTALRTVTTAETVLVRVECDDGSIGWGEAPPTLAITGDSMGGIEAFIDWMGPQLVGEDPTRLERIMAVLHRGSVRNTSAKAALDMAIYDLASKAAGLPLYRFLGGFRDGLETDYTVSVNPPEEMGEDAARFVSEGYKLLKIKVGGGELAEDLRRIEAIRKRVGSEVGLKLDANQAWDAKGAVAAIRTIEKEGLGVELVEQPVKAWDLEGLERVTKSVDMPIMADESVFSPEDAAALLRRGAADLINIKLMKAGGLHRAIAICKAAESFGVPCMVGSMIESHVGVTAAAHLAAAMRNVVTCDLDAPILMASNPVRGGIAYEGMKISLPQTPGLGIAGVEGFVPDRR